MKYKTIIETDNIKGFKFFEDSNGKYIVGKDAGAENDEWIALYFTECKSQQKQTLREEPNPCDFCETIYPDADTKDIVFRKGKYSDFNKCIFITIDDEGKYYVNVDPGDPYKLGYLCDVKFCPYCGRKLIERR